MNFTRLKQVSLLFACLSIMAPSLGHAADTFIGVGPTGYFQVNATQGTVQFKGTVPLPTSAIARHQDSGYIYVYGGNSTKYFGYWNPVTGGVTQIKSYTGSARLDEVRMDFSPNGTLYLSDAQERLYTLDRQNGAVTLLGTMSGLQTGAYGATGDMAFAPDGTLWIADDRNLYTVDPVTLQATTVFTGMIDGLGPSDVGVWSGLAYCDGLLYASTTELRSGESELSSSLISIDPQTGLETFVLDPQINLTDLSACPLVPVGNTPPNAIAQSLVNGVDQPSGILLSGDDADGDPLTYVLADLPSHGTLTGVGPNLTYVPDTGFKGQDDFTFTVSDGQAVSAAATVTVRTVAPDASDLTFFGANAYGHDEIVEVNVTQSYAYTIGSLPFGTQAMARDPESGLVYFYEWLSSATRFAYWDPATGSSAVIRTYSPINGFRAKRMDFAPDGTLFLIDDAEGFYTIDKSTGNIVPLGRLTGLETGEWAATGDMAFAPDGTLWINNYRGLYTVDLATLVATEIYSGLIGTVPPGDGAVWSGLAYCGGLLYGSAIEFDSELSPVFSIDPSTGQETFLFYSNSKFLNDMSSCNEFSGSSNRTPFAFDQSESVHSGASLPIALSASDEDGDVLTYQIVDVPVHGSLSGSGSDYVYESDAGFVGSDSFTFTASDGQATSNLATVSITVEEDPSLNSPPVAADQNVSTDQGVSLSITLSAIDDDGDALVFEIVSGVGDGALSGSGASQVYTPDAGFFGTDSFEFRAYDGEDFSNGAVVTIQVNEVVGPNNPPTAIGQSVATSEGTDVSITLTATDPDGDTLSYAIVAEPVSGTLTGNGSSYVYTPDAGFVGIDGFEFVANDGQLDSNAASVSIDVTPVSGVDLDVFGVGSAGLFGINLTQGSSAFEDTLPITTVAIARDRQSGHVYFYGGNSTKYLAYRDSASGAITPISSYQGAARLDAVRMDFSPNGTLYLSDGQERLYTLDTQTGAVTLLGTLSGLETGSYGPTGDLAFAPDGTMWVANYRTLYTVDLVSLQATPVYTGMLDHLGANDVGVWSGLAYCNGQMYASTAELRSGESVVGSSIVRIDPQTGQETFMFDAQANLGDLTSC